MIVGGLSRLESIVMKVLFSRILLPVLVLLFLMCWYRMWVRKTILKTTVQSAASWQDESGHRRTYVLVLRLAGQQGSGVRSLSVFQCVLSSIYGGFYIVEPSVKETHLTASVEKDVNHLTFSSIFDFEYFNEKSRGIGYPEMVDMNRFAIYAPELVVYVYIRPEGKLTGIQSQKVVWDTSVDKIRCLDSEWISSLARPYRLALSNSERVLGDLKPGACIVRIIELWVCDYSTHVEFPQLKSALNGLIFGEWSPQDVTLVFTYWYNKLFVPVYMPLNGVNCMQKYAENETKAQFRPSDRLIRDAEKYVRMFLGGKNELAIMLRVERVLKFYLVESMDANKKSLKQCLDEVLVLRLNKTAKRPFVTLDIGRFGTNSFHNIAEKQMVLSSTTLMSLYENKWTVRKWEDSFVQAAGGVTDVGYIAAMQRAIASRADCLILMGGGSFQSLAVYDYLQYHNHKTSMGWKPCIHLVCVMTTRNTEVQKTMKNY